MPKSKRAKVVPLTKAKKKTREHKEKRVTAVRDCVDQFSFAYVFRYENMRNQTLKELRDELQGETRFFLGSNKVLQVALGRSKEDAYRDGLEQLAGRLGGDAGLLFTNTARAELETSLAEHEVPHFARAGTIATGTVELEAGPLVTPAGGSLPHTMEPFLRANGLPTRLNKGVIELLGPHTVCKEGSEISAAAAAVLKVFDYKLATFRLILDSVWENGAFEVINEPEERPGGGGAAGAALGGGFDDDDLEDDGGDFSVTVRDV